MRAGGRARRRRGLGTDVERRRSSKRWVEVVAAVRGPRAAGGGGGRARGGGEEERRAFGLEAGLDHVVRFARGEEHVHDPEADED